MALSADKAGCIEKDSPYRVAEHQTLAADSTQFYKGGLVGINASGKLVKYTAAAGIKPAGVCIENVLTGTSNTRQVKHASGTFKFVNGDSIAQSDVGFPAYASDDETVVKARGAATSFVGMVYAVDSDGVWVSIAYPATDALNRGGDTLLTAAVHYESTGTTWDFVGGYAPPGVTVTDVGVGVFRLTVAGAERVFPAGMPVLQRATPAGDDSTDVFFEILAITATSIDIGVFVEENETAAVAGQKDLADLSDNDLIYVPLAVRF